MKKVIILILIVFAITNFAYAGSSANSRSKCRWYAKRYSTNAHLSAASLSCGVHYSSNHDNGCEWAESYVVNNWCCDINADAFAHIDGNGQNKYFHKACDISAGLLSELYNDLNVNNDIRTSTYPGSQEDKFLPIFANHQVIIDNLSLVMISSTSDVNENVYTLGIWMPQDDPINGIEDSVYNSSKSLFEGKVRIQNGKLYITGNLFTVSDFEIINDGNLITVKYIGGRKTFEIIPSINTDDLAVYSAGDIKPNENEFFKGIVSKNSGVIEGNSELLILQNPINSNLKVNFKSKEKENIDISIYNTQGKLVLQQKSYRLNEGDNFIIINTDALPPDNYFVLAEGNKVKIIKQIVKQ